MSDVTSRAWWRWESMIGALVTDYGPGVRIVSVSKGYIHGSAVEVSTNNHGLVWMRLRKERCTAVDETDPATLGCLTQRARELWGDDAHIGINHRDPSEWIVWARLGAAGWWTVVARGPTEFSALLAACDAAPNPTTSSTTPQGHTP